MEMGSTGGGVLAFSETKRGDVKLSCRCLRSQVHDMVIFAGESLVDPCHMLKSTWRSAR